MYPNRLAVVLVLCAAATPAFAHPGHAMANGFASGLFHPLLGLDHMLAMLAVGVWSTLLGERGVYLLPAAFVAMLAGGAMFALSGVPLPGVEPTIAASGIALGAALAFKARPPAWAAGVLVGAFALFHGHAHGHELPVAASPLGYVAGFMLTTVVLHLIGVVIGLAARRPRGMLAVRAGGGTIGALSLGLFAATM